MEFNEYNILIAPSSEHFKQTLTVMLSAMLNCNKKCIFFIMQFDWTEQQKKYCANFVSAYPGNKVEFFDVDNEPLKDFISFRGYYNAYYKMIAHLYLSEEIDRVMYIDTDAIINKDIYNFYSMDFDGNYMIASAENASQKVTDSLKNVTQPEHGYVNTGVVMFNLSLLRKDNITLSFYADTVKNSSKKYLADQGILPFAFRDRIKVLPSYKYNHMLFHEGDQFGYKKIFSMTKEERRNNLCPEYWEEIDMDENESIIHFAGYVSKPWDTVYKVKNGSASIEIPFLRHGLTVPMVEHLYFKWWNIAKQLPLEIYEEFLLEAYEKNIGKGAVQGLENQLTWSRNAQNFFEKMSYDCILNKKFEQYLSSLNGKSISALKIGDLAGKFLLKCAEANNIRIAFSTTKGGLAQLTPEEWEKCRNADVIINCCVHGMQAEERDGMRDIMINDIMNMSVTSSNPPVSTGNDAQYTKLHNDYREITEKYNAIETKYNALKTALKQFLE